MKIIIPLGGRGTRVIPHTYSKPKPFVNLAGKFAIDFLIEHLLTVKPEEIIIVHDEFSASRVKEYLPKKYPQTKFSFKLQREALGTGHAIYQAKELIKEGDNLLICYCDTIFEGGLDKISNLSEEVEGILYAVEVPDPEHYGILENDGAYITGLVEKPKEPKSNLANIGLYYIKNGYNFMSNYLQKVMDTGLNAVGEYYLTDAFILMIQDGKKLVAEPVAYMDTGTVEKMILANAKLLQGKVAKGENVRLDNCEIGENVSIGDNTTLVNCKIKNSIVGSNTYLEGFDIENSLIGDNNNLKKNGKTLNIGDKCSMN
jgi:glucose-1-phosphate thymidylyltransferase